MILLGITACGRDGEAPASARIAPTNIPEPTPLPPLPTVPVLGSDANPLRILLALPDGLDTDVAAQELAATLSDEAQMIIDVEATDSYAEAFRALCEGQAHAVLLNALGALAASDLNCGEMLYVLELDGETATQGQMITAVGRNVFSVLAFRGRVFCRTDANSIHGWIVPSFSMRAQGIDPASDLLGIVDADSDNEVVLRIFQRECDVGATSLGAEVGIENPNPAQSGRILVIQELPPVPNDIVLLSSQLGPELGAMLHDLLDQYKDDLASLVEADALVEVTGDDFAGLRDLLGDAGVDISTLSQ